MENIFLFLLSLPTASQAGYFYPLDSKHVLRAYLVGFLSAVFSVPYKLSAPGRDVLCTYHFLNVLPGSFGSFSVT